MDNVISIQTLAGEFASFNELTDYSNKQFIALKKANDKIKQLEEEVSHLQTLLTSTTTLLNDNKVDQIIITPEEALCLSQIRILEERGRDKELTLEETKKLDLLIKNLNVIRSNNPKTIENKKLPNNLPNYQLLKLASQVSIEPSNE